MSLVVTLDPDQQKWARDIGAQRIALAPGNPRFAYKERSGLDTHTIGAMAELAFAAAAGLEWPARIGSFRDRPDVDPFWEVRWASNPKWVKVATDDHPDQLVVHVTGKIPTFEVHGFIVAGWVQTNFAPIDPGERGWKAHFVDPYYLTPINEGFHDICAWFDHPVMGWMCLYCGRFYEEARYGAG